MTYLAGEVQFYCELQARIDGGELIYFQQIEKLHNDTMEQHGVDAKLPCEKLKANLICNIENATITPSFGNKSSHLCSKKKKKKKNSKGRNQNSC